MRSAHQNLNERVRSVECVEGTRTWNVSSEQKLMTLPRLLATMCCPAACESSQTDLRLTFKTYKRCCQLPLYLRSR